MYEIAAENLKYEGNHWVYGLNAVVNELNSKGSHFTYSWSYLDMMQDLLPGPSVDIVFSQFESGGKETKTIERVFKTMSSVSAACTAIEAFNNLSKKAIDNFLHDITAENAFYKKT